jgi:hypothetical protein
MQAVPGRRAGAPIADDVEVVAAPGPPAFGSRPQNLPMSGCPLADGWAESGKDFRANSV